MGSKRRVFQVAREFNISNEALIGYLVKLNYEIRNHMSPVSETAYEEIRKKYGTENVTIDPDYEFRKRLREKRAQEEARREKEKRQLQERIETSKRLAEEKMKKSLEEKQKETFRTKTKATARIEAKPDQEADRDKTVLSKQKPKVLKVIEIQPDSHDKGTPDFKIEEKELIEKKEEPVTKVVPTDEKLTVASDKIEKVKEEEKKSKEDETVKAFTTDAREDAESSKVKFEKVDEKKYSDDKQHQAVAADEKLAQESRVMKGKNSKLDRDLEIARAIRSEEAKVYEVKAEKEVEIKGRDRLVDRNVKKGKEHEPKSTEKVEEQKEDKEGAVAKDQGKKKKRRTKKKKVRIESPQVSIFDENVEKQVEAEVEAQEKKLMGVKDLDEDKAKRKRRRRRKKKEATVGPAKLTEKTKRQQKKKKKPVFDDEEIEASIRQTMAAIEDRGKIKKRYKKSRADDDEIAETKNIIQVTEQITIADFARLIEVEPAAIIQKCFELGLMVSINQRLDQDTIILVSAELGIEVEIVPEIGMEKIDSEPYVEEEDDILESRPPVVTIMGHVDHGKTTLLDYICNTNIVASEAGGITQHIGAYKVPVNGKSITFLDTPGHEAFTAMRARGAQVTDIVVLVVAADDAVMPQTIEAINHAKAAQVPIIVAINKIDKPNANPDKIRQQLSENGVLVESWGGKYQDVELSAKSGIHVEKLLELILLESEMLELKANPDRLARGVIIESRMDKGRGITATVLVQKGTLKIGDPFIAGQYSGKVRSMFNEFGRKVKVATPSTPVITFGFDGLPEAGDTFIVMKAEKDAKEIAEKRKDLRREQYYRPIKLTLDQIAAQIKKGEIKQLKLILKADAGGSVEAISEQLMKLSNDEVAVDIIHQGVGAITESDILLAVASNAFVIGFHVRPTLKARELATREKIDIRLYDVIYEITTEVKAALEGFLEPEITEQLCSTIEVREIFKVPKVGLVAGCHVLSGKVTRNHKVKIYRDDKFIQDSRISSLKRFKEDVKEVTSGFDCGITFEKFDDVKVSDVIETYDTVEVKRTL